MEKALPALHTTLQQFAYREVGSTRLLNFTANRVCLTDAAFALAIAHPQIIEHEGCWIIEDNFDIARFEEWRQAFSGDRSKIEFYSNLVDLEYAFRTKTEDRDLCNTFAEVMKVSWGYAISARLAEPFEVQIIENDIGFPSLTFSVIRHR